MGQITNRECAWVILTCAFVAVVVLVPNLRRSVVPSLRRLLAALRSRAIICLLIYYVAYLATVLVLASRIGFWTMDQLKDTIVLAVAVGGPLLISVHKFGSGAAMIRRVLVNTLGAAAFLAFFVHLESLALWAEVVVQGVTAILILISVGVSMLPRYARTKQAVRAARILILVALFVYTTRTVITEWSASDWSAAAWSLALSVWLPFALLPFLYVSAFLVMASSALKMALFRDGQARHKPMTRLAGYYGFHFSLRLCNEFVSDWRSALGDTHGFREGIAVMKRFRHAVKTRDRNLEAYAKHMDATEGVSGFDRDGLLLDRHEFHITKERLDDIYWPARANYQDARRGYNAEVLRLLPSLYADGLSDEVSLRISRDRQSWMGWRQTPSGWHFGVGGTKNWQEQWQFDGPNPPSGFPQTKNDGWREVFEWKDRRPDPRSPEWSKDDEPPVLAAAHDTLNESQNLD
ncbi:MAG: hypothetical protein Q7L55_04975 [Actinomycetota bacterium]|nr:hypothetical protein [Actinomycetota bacterium]